MIGNLTIQIYAIKMFFISIFTYYTFLKVNDIIEYNKSIRKNLIVGIGIVIVALVSSFVKFHTNSLISISMVILLLGFLFSMSTKIKLGTSIIITLVASACNYMIYFIAAICIFAINRVLKISNDIINLSLIFIIYAIILAKILSLKKIKYGIAFLKNNTKNDYFDVLVLNISIIMLFCVVLFTNRERMLSKSIFFSLIFSAVIMFITIQKSLQLYYKQKMLVKELDETKEDLARAENKIKILEKENIEESKKRHTVIHKQKSLEYKITEMLTKTEMSTGEAAEVRERLEKLNKEVYTEKEVMELDKTGISSIDDMLKYMQSECVKNKIDFILQIKGNIHYMVHNLVKEEELETLLADHIKDAIIAINHTDNANRSILVRLGNIDDIYSLYIYDSGVEFKPEVLENLGKKPCTTYENEGGTGMGFMNTFDTLRKHKASLIIEEINKPTEDNYTKAIIIKFDKKNEFKVKSYHEIEKV